MSIGAGATSATVWIDIEGDADDAVVEGFVNPKAIFEDETLGFTLMVLVVVLAATEKTFWGPSTKGSTAI
jgi:hypothetical protein